MDGIGYLVRIWILPLHPMALGGTPSPWLYKYAPFVYQVFSGLVDAFTRIGLYGESLDRYFICGRACRIIMGEF